MNPIDLINFKKAGYNFYCNIGENPGLSDDVYDKLEREFMDEFNMTHEDVIQMFTKSDKSNPVTGLKFSGVNKEKYSPDEIIDKIKEFIGDEYLESGDYVIMYKHDGSSIGATYKDSVIDQIFSTPTDDTHKDKWDNFKEFFPVSIFDKDIIGIMGEVLVSVDKFGEKARQNANAMVNRKKDLDKIKDSAFIRVYKLEFNDGEWDFYRWRNSLTRLKSHNSDLWKVAEFLTFDDIIASTDVITPIYKDHVMIDGYVVYTPNGSKAFKFQYLNSKDVICKNIRWDKQDNGNVVPIVEFDPFEMDGVKCNELNPNGIRTLLDNGINIGCKFKYVKIGNTIPGIAQNSDGSRIIYDHGNNYVSDIDQFVDEVTNIVVSGSGPDELKGFVSKYFDPTDELIDTIYDYLGCNSFMKEGRKYGLKIYLYDLMYNTGKCDCGTYYDPMTLLDSNMYCMNKLCQDRFLKMRSRFSSLDKPKSTSEWAEFILKLIDINGVTENKYIGKFDDGFYPIYKDIEGNFINSIYSIDPDEDFDEWMDRNYFIDPKNYDADIVEDLSNKLINYYNSRLNNIFKNDKKTLFELNIPIALIIIQAFITR